MNEVEIKLDNGEGAFIIKHENKQAGEMIFQLSGTEMIVNHTEVDPQFEGKGLAKKMFLKMIKYARENKLKVVANCSYVQAQIQKNKEEYTDVI
ncbi:MAG: GNAT family N-acetyltransferase [Ginsengibacter sp.]